MKIILTGKEYEEIIKTTVDSISTEDHRPILKRINLKVCGNTLEAVSIDGVRLSKTTIERLHHINDDAEITIEPIKPVKNVDIVEIEKSDKVTTITQTTTAGTQSQSTFVTMDGYMNYNQIIKPDIELENHIAISLDANLLAGLLKSFKDKSNNNRVTFLVPKEPLQPLYLKINNEVADVLKLILPLRY